MVEFLQFLLSGLVIGSIYGLIGIGFTAVYNVTGIVNFAQGDFAMLGAMVTIALLAAGAPMLAAFVLAVILVALLAAFVERWFVRPASETVMRGIVITIGIGIVVQGAVVLLFGADPRSMPAFSGDGVVRLAGATLPLQSLWVLGIALVMMVLLHLFFARSFLGKALRACAINPRAARLMGIRVTAMSQVAFVLSGALGAIAGIIIAPITLTQFDTGIAVGIKGFVAGIIGGFGHPVGAALGGLILGLLEAFASGYLSSGFKNAIAYLALLGFLFFRPGGILGELEAQRA